MAAADPRAIARIYSECSMLKRRSISAYTLFAHEVVTGRAEPAAQAALLEEMAQGAIRRPVGVVAELNGSARCLSIDRDFLEGLGLEVRAVNDKPRQFAHRIVPEGESLDQCRTALEAAAADDPAFVAGYVPDCDGDRGNLVRFDAASASARPIEAQEVFALACVAELASLVRDGALGYDESGNAKQKVAVVVNDATSMRVNAIARAFDVDVYRSETGEANVVGLAAELRAKGYVVRILGEGSNGGNITHPSSVRDPLATLGALLKLLLLRGSEVGGDDGGGEGLFRIWMRLSGRLANYRPEFDLGDIVASLPAYATTSVFEARAALKVASYDQASLKARYATLFLREWESRKAELASRFGAVSWEAFATRGTAETRVGSDFAASGTGGLRIALADGSGRPVAFLWMRASGTEPVFRIMADVEGGRAEDEAYLLAWHESMVRGADRAPLAESGGIS
jgi:phosphoglucomutase